MPEGQLAFWFGSETDYTPTSAQHQVGQQLCSPYSMSRVGGGRALLSPQILICAHVVHLCGAVVASCAAGAALSAYTPTTKVTMLLPTPPPSLASSAQAGGAASGYQRRAAALGL